MGLSPSSSSARDGWWLYGKWWVLIFVGRDLVVIYWVTYSTLHWWNVCDDMELSLRSSQHLHVLILDLFWRRPKVVPLFLFVPHPLSCEERITLHLLGRWDKCVRLGIRVTFYSTVKAENIEWIFYAFSWI